jgi:hypothetical protein
MVCGEHGAMKWVDAEWPTDDGWEGMFGPICKPCRLELREMAMATFRTSRAWRRGDVDPPSKTS